MSASAIKIQVVEEDDEDAAAEENKTSIKESQKFIKKTTTKLKKTLKKIPAKKTVIEKKPKKVSRKAEIINTEIEKIVVPKPQNTEDLIVEKMAVDTASKVYTEPEVIEKAPPKEIITANTAEDISALINNEAAPQKNSSFFNKINSVIKKKPQADEVNIDSKQDIAGKADAVNTEIFNNAKAEVKINTAVGGRVKNLIAQLEEDRDEKEVKAPESEIEINNIQAGRSVKIYRKIAYFFIFLVIVLFGFVAYYSFVTVTIVLIPNQERISNNMIFDIRDQDTMVNESGNTIAGIVKKVDIQTTKQFNSTGNEVIGKEVAGTVTIFNNYTKNQPLVASTRLLSTDNKLFRIKNTVNVPAGGSIEVEIYADEPGPDAAVGPTKFSIPGLWAGLQDKIFAESKESIDYKQKVKKYITQSDIEDSSRELKQQLLTEAKTQINEKYKDYGEIIYKINENSVATEADNKVNNEVETFNMAMTAEVVVVAFNEEKTADLAKQKFLSSLSENKELISFDEKNIVYTLNNYDSNLGSATVNATFEGKISIKDNFDIVEVDKIVGLNNKQLEVYLKNIAEIAGYEIKYTPSFIKRVPNLIDRIKIEIKK